MQHAGAPFDGGPNGREGSTLNQRSEASQMFPMNPIPRFRVRS
jgi:hypothetical protein